MSQVRSRLTAPDFRALEVVDLRPFGEVVQLHCFQCVVLLQGPTIFRDCTFSRCDLLVQWGKYLAAAATSEEDAAMLGGSTNPLQLGSTGRRLLRHLLPRDLPVLG